MIDEELLFFMKVCGLLSRVVMLLLILLCFLHNPFVSFQFIICSCSFSPYIFLIVIIVLIVLHFLHFLCFQNLSCICCVLLISMFSSFYYFLINVIALF